MATAIWVALRPYNEAPRRPCQAERGTINYVNTDADADSLSQVNPQPGRIISLHWLRSEPMEAAHG